MTETPDIPGDADGDDASLSGATFSRVVRAGALAVVREQEALNRINVFPVRDADTGANLAATLKAAASRLGSEAPESVGDAARVAADGALDGARGNSGAIFAQFLHGLASSLERLGRADGRQFAEAAENGTRSAYSALQDPREGTILRVLRAWSHELSRRAHEEDLPGAAAQRARGGAGGSRRHAAPARGARPQPRGGRGRPGVRLLPRRLDRRPHRQRAGLGAGRGPAARAAAVLRRAR